MPTTRYTTVFLDAGGVMITPNFTRLAEALARRGITASADTLAEIEPYVKLELDHAPTIQATDDRGRGYVYFDRILELAGIPPARPRRMPSRNWCRSTTVRAPSTWSRPARWRR